MTAIKYYDTAGTRADLASILSALRRSAPSRGQFPCSADDMDPIHEQFILHADNLDDIDRGTAITPEMLWKENRSVWCARVEPLWADFCGARATNYKPAPLLDATPTTAWLYFEEGFSRIWCVARTCGLAGLQLNHYQMLFLMRQMERVSEMLAWLSHDAARPPLTDHGLQLNHYQMLFLMRQMERVSEMLAWLSHDAARPPLTDHG
ncbi:N-terminal region of Chorein or VPS13 [Castilleja foliolosa]|uniref:N-terminal region of Chorein or VPS13 n=1 Tax=Castilleja foliolosa TaxID=1961234 RepID=A0ABD3B712_9LAMI